ncbi:MAG: putative bifunctional diguanylate cyclase/phosphodiesterase [Betaproteobacteria bacterium]
MHLPLIWPLLTIDRPRWRVWPARRPAKRKAESPAASDARQEVAVALFDTLPEGLMVTDAEHRVVDINPAGCALLGEPRAAVLGRVPGLLQALLTDPGLQVEREQLRAACAAGLPWRGEIRQRRPNGDPRALRLTIARLGPDGGRTGHAIALADITQSWLQHEQLERQVYLDPLTQLPNRLRLAALLKHAMQASDAQGHLLVVAYLDLDHFKQLNDRLGHSTGDRALVEIAGRLREALRCENAGGGALARLGGDEFVLLIRAASHDEGRLAIERLLGVIAAPLACAPGRECVTASVGATVYPMDCADPDTVLRHADHAMVAAKQAGRSGYLFFDAEHSRQTEARFEALGRVQEAIDADEFALHYQPKVDLRSGAVLGVEALLRWRHPREGLITPGRFLPLIEHTSLSERLGDWVFEQAVRQLATWRRAGLDLAVSVNVSARHLQSPRFAERLRELLASHPGVQAGRLELEVLETAALADIDYSASLMQRCRQFGVRFALDDFGTGYSTLTYLKRLPLDVLKIDRSFVHTMLEDPEDLAIVEGVIGLARTFGCAVVAEGVESADQAARLVALGCPVGQGNGIAEPMPAAEVAAWVRGWRGLPLPATAREAAG